MEFSTLKSFMFYAGAFAVTASILTYILKRRKETDIDQRIIGRLIALYCIAALLMCPPLIGLITDSVPWLGKFNGSRPFFTSAILYGHITLDKSDLVTYDVVAFLHALTAFLCVPAVYKLTRNEPEPDARLRTATAK